MRQKIFEVIEVAREGNKASKVYDWFMMCLILASLVPLAFKGTNGVFSAMTSFTTACFIVDYAMRFVTADL